MASKLNGESKCALLSNTIENDWRARARQNIYEPTSGVYYIASIYSTRDTEYNTRTIILL